MPRALRDRPVIIGARAATNRSKCTRCGGRRAVDAKNPSSIGAGPQQYRWVSSGTADTTASISSTIPASSSTCTVRRDAASLRRLRNARSCRDLAAYTTCAGRPSAASCSAIATIGVTPMPPTISSAGDGSEASRKLLPTERTSIVAPTRSCSCMKREPPLFGSRFSQIRWRRARIRQRIRRRDEDRRPARRALQT
jgi:hypothetical protein